MDNQQSLDCIECELQNLLIALHPPLPPTPAEPFGEVIHQYTNTLGTTQKQTKLNNSLIQDIDVFNEYDSTKLEEWLMDIEAAADLTNECQAKLAKAKLRGLTHALLMEAITSDNSWDKIKDLIIIIISFFFHLVFLYTVSLQLQCHSNMHQKRI